MGERSLNVIDGDWLAPPEWLTFPKVVKARSPLDKAALCEFRVSHGDLFKAAGLRRRQPAYDFWSSIVGRVPPVPGSDKLTIESANALTTLQDANACFRGIQRPCGEHDDGAGYIAYALKPKVMFACDLRPPIVQLNRLEVPPDLVFMAFARLDVSSEPATNMGVLTHWQFVDADEIDPNLPVDHQNRFAERLW